jgi:hypothetical protein
MSGEGVCRAVQAVALKMRILSHVKHASRQPESRTASACRTELERRTRLHATSLRDFFDIRFRGVAAARQHGHTFASHLSRHLT